MAGRSSIYEVFRACRLCGGGGGYKMPIVNPDDELDMRHRIRECVRIEVHHDDKMPPLICELCVDKVNDYFEFLEMCRSTDTRTRDRLGLPHSTQRHGGDSDCILGVTEPVFVNDESSDAEPLARHRNRTVVGSGRRGGRAASPPPAPAVPSARAARKDVAVGLKELRVSLNGSRDGGGSSRESSAARASRSGRRPPSPRRSRRDRSADEPLVQPAKKEEKKARPQKGILKYQTKVEPEEDKSLLRVKTRPAGKRERERDKEQPRATKRVKIAIKPPAPAARAERRRAPTPPRAEPKRRPEPPPAHACPLCSGRFAKPAALAGHMRATHSPTFTADKLACNACGAWFRGADEATTHHRWHKSAPAPYVCRLCTAEFRQPASYAKHFASRQCVPSPEVPDEQCPACWQYFPTSNLLRHHRCRGEDGRPGGNCAKCKRKLMTYKTLRRHEEICCKPGPRSRGGAFKASPEMLRQVTPLQVRVARVDPLLARVKLERHYDVSHVTPDFGLDKSCVYPYIASVRTIKTEPHDYDLDNVKDELFDYEDDFANYESYTDSDSEPEMTAAPAPERSLQPNLVPNPFARKKRSIDALSTLSIKAIFSSKFLGSKKIQRKRKRRLLIKPEIKTEETEKTGQGDTRAGDTFDSLLNEPVDKETKKEMIDVSNKENVTVDLENRDRGEKEGEKSLEEKSCDVAIVEKEAVEVSMVAEGANESLNKNSEADRIDKLFDDDMGMDQDVSSAVDSLIAGLADNAENDNENNLKDVEKTSTGDKSDVDKSTTVLPIVDGNNENVLNKDKSDTELAVEKSEEQEKLNVSVPVTEGDSDSNKIDETEVENISVLDKLEEDTKNNDSIEENPKSTLKDTEINNISKKMPKNVLEDDDDFDVDSMFSGDLGATALKSKAKLSNQETSKINIPDTTLSIHSESDKTDTTNSIDSKSETENPTIDVRLGQTVDAEEVLSESRGQSRGDAQNCESLESKHKNNSGSDNVVDSSAATGNSANGDGLSVNEEKGVDIKINDSLDKSDIAETKPRNSDVNEDDLLKDKISDTELENMSDTEMDDKELMDALDAQISNNTSEKTFGASVDTEKPAESKILGTDDSEATKPDEAATERSRTTENNKVSGVGTEVGNTEEKPKESEDKISLDDLLIATAPAKANRPSDDRLRDSMDLDCISDDEFNFDT